VEYYEKNAGRERLQQGDTRLVGQPPPPPTFSSKKRIK
jgi:hypothetical protein